MEIAVIMVACLWVGFFLGSPKPLMRLESKMLAKVRDGALSAADRERFHGGGVFASSFECELSFNGVEFLLAVTPKREGRAFCVSQTVSDHASIGG